MKSTSRSLLQGATRGGATREPQSLLKRAFVILSVLPSRDPIALADVATRAALPKPTVHRILRTLIHLGQASQDDGGLYRSTGRLAPPASASVDAIRASALPRMRALHRRLDETVNLGVLDGEAVRYLHVLESTRPLRLLTIPGATDPAHCTALGRALLGSVLSSKGPAERVALMRSWTLAPRTPRTILDRQELLGLLEAAARRGYAEEREENDIGVACVAVVLRGLDSDGTSAISVTIPTARYTPERRREVIQALSQEMA